MTNRKSLEGTPRLGMIDQISLSGDICERIDDIYFSNLGSR